MSQAKRFAADHLDMDNYWWYLNYEAAGNYFGTGCSHFEPIAKAAGGGEGRADGVARVARAGGRGRRGGGVGVADVAGAAAGAGDSTGVRSASPAVSAAEFTAAYVAIFAPLTKGLVALRDTGVMWSPTFNDETARIDYRPALLGNVTNLFKQLPLLTEVANQDAIGKYSLFNVSSGVRASACVCHSDES